jgi:hypothetical protein
MKRISFCALLVLLGSWTADSFQSSAAQTPDELLLLGFEDAEFEKLSKLIKLTKAVGKTKDNKPFVAWNIDQLGQWNLFEGDASQGKRAMKIGIARKPDVKIYDLRRIPFGIPIPADAVDYYGHYVDNYSVSGGNHLHTGGIFRRIFPVDWSAYDLLRFDVRCEEGVHTIRVTLEDEEIAPPLVRNIKAPAGKWATVEVDLREAERVRRLDLKTMATLTVAIVGSEAPLDKPATGLMDNLRLCKKSVAATLPVVRDTTSLELPAYYKSSSKPVPEKMPALKPDRSPLKIEKPFVIETGQLANVSYMGWAAAYDNQNLLVGFSGSKDGFALQSNNGGKSWRGLDGGPKPAVMPLPYLDHQNARGDVVGQRADVLLLADMGCNGMVMASPRLWARKLSFTDKGWVLTPDPVLVDCDLRHCNSNQSIVRSSDGRLWAAYGLVGRLGTNCINVRYSDDDGATWKSSREGTSGVIPGTIHPEKEGVGFGRYTFEEPCLVPFGPAVACIWEEWGPNSINLKWAKFDGTKWSAIEEIAQMGKGSTVFNRPHIHAVSIDGKEIFMASGFREGIYHHRDGRWQKEPVKVPFGTRLSLAGGKTVMAFAVRSENADRKKGPMVIQTWQRRSDGEWSDARELAREEIPISVMQGLNELRPGLVVQTYSPPNFVPIAWSCDGQKWIKYLRVPVGD